MGNSPSPKFEKRGVQWAPKLKNGQWPSARNSKTKWHRWVETEKMGKSPGLELKNKMASLGFKKMAFQDGVELTPFLAFDFFLGMMSGRKTSSHSQ